MNQLHPILFTLLFTSLTVANANVSTYFEKIKTNPNSLSMFLTSMPKGGELHYHLGGGAYSETMLALAATGKFCLDKKTFVMNKTNDQCLGITSNDLMQNPSLYEQTIRSWSLKNFNSGKESSHDHFFATFSKFRAIVDNYKPELLASIMRRAASQHELYMEVLDLPDNGRASNFANPQFSTTSFASAQKNLLANEAFQANIQYTIDEASRIIKQARQILGCETDPNQEVCQIKVKFQYYAFREQPLEKVFAQALNGFVAASRSPDIVGVNLVQPEDGIISLRDYRQQMQIFNYLHQAYPKVHISLHAGELVSGLVTPEDLRFHIHDAVKLGQAERIGHGVDIALENNAETLLQDMANHHIAVEVNLTSNQKILNVSGANHPLKIYLAKQVPIVLSTDDEGILRTDLTHQYVTAVMQFDLDYPTVKLINRNALTYSFLPGKSLWDNAKLAIPVKDCQDLNSQRCKQFIKNSEKAQLQWLLETKLTQFENSYAN